MSAEDNNNEQHSGGREVISNNKECTSCEQFTVDSITKGIDSVALPNGNSKCASCGKEGNGDDMNTCNKCKGVKYCNAACKKKHRKKHKKACEKRVAELHEEQLFKDPPPPEECPICMLTPPLDGEVVFQSCCGKLICVGCIYAMKTSERKDLCAFCRTPDANTDEEHIKRIEKLMDNGNGDAFHALAGLYAAGALGLTQDDSKANELYQKAGELGCANGYYNLGLSYDLGYGVEVNEEKAKHYFELAAIGGHMNARYNLGCLEGEAFKRHRKIKHRRRAMKHFVMAAKAGETSSLEAVKEDFMNGFVTKDRYASILRAYHERQAEMKSEERDKAVAAGLYTNG